LGLVRNVGVVGFVAAVVMVLPPGGAAIEGPTVTARAPLLYRNCTNLNKRYPHGVGRPTARDKTSGTPVTNFRRSTRIYNTAMSHNRGLDRDKDGIACEKA
jgi:excalibur calcium-binding domain-containing protein